MFAETQSGEISRTHAQIAADLGIGVSTSKRIVPKLRRCGIVDGRQTGYQQPNVYNAPARRIPPVSEVSRPGSCRVSVASPPREAFKNLRETKSSEDDWVLPAVTEAYREGGWDRTLRHSEQVRLRRFLADTPGVTPEAIREGVAVCLDRTRDPEAIGGVWYFEHEILKAVRRGTRAVPERPPAPPVPVAPPAPPGRVEPGAEVLRNDAGASHSIESQVGIVRRIEGARVVVEFLNGATEELYLTAITPVRKRRNHGSIDPG